MKRDYRLYIDDILEAIRRIEKYSKGLSFDDFSKNNMLMDAVVRNFEIIGEATKHLPQSMRRKYPKLPWKMMSGMRDKLIHEYFGVNVEVLWKTIQEGLPELKPKVEELLTRMDEEIEK